MENSLSIWKPFWHHRVQPRLLSSQLLQSVYVLQFKKHIRCTTTSQTHHDDGKYMLFWRTTVSLPLKSESSSPKDSEGRCSSRFRSKSWEVQVNPKKTSSHNLPTVIEGFEVCIGALQKHKMCKILNLKGTIPVRVAQASLTHVGSVDTYQTGDRLKVGASTGGPNIGVGLNVQKGSDSNRAG